MSNNNEEIDEENYHFSVDFVQWVVILASILSFVLVLYFWNFYLDPEPLIKFFDLFNKSNLIKENYQIIFTYPQILLTIGFFITYVYFFHSIKTRGVSLLESNEIESKQFAFVIFIIKIFTGLIVIASYCYYLIKEQAIEQFVLIIVIIIIYLIIRHNIFRRYQFIINQYRQIICYIKYLQSVANFPKKWILSNLGELLDIILLLTILTAFFGIYRGYNLFTILIFEFILVEIFFLFSLINKIPKYFVNIHLKTNKIFSKVFIIYESPKEYLIILDENDKKTEIYKNSINFISKI